MIDWTQQMPNWATAGAGTPTGYQQAYQASIAPPRPAYLDALSQHSAPGVMPSQYAPTASTGGDFGTIPSQQAYNRLAPSEQAGYNDWLSTQQGQYAPDVLNLMGALKPQSYYGQTPKWAEF